MIQIIKEKIDILISFLNKYIKQIKIFLVLISLSSIIVYFSPLDTYKEFGTLSWIFLIIVMLIRPIRDIFPKCKIFVFLGKFRREMGILVGIFGIAHVLGFALIMQYKDGILGLFTDEYVWKYTGMLFWGMLAFLVSIPLLLTSNGYATKLLGKNWKKLQYLAYFMFPFVAIHIFLIKGEFGPLIPIIAWLILFTIAHIKNKKLSNSSSKGPKWLCVPCGWIYDENIGDPDSGIAPGTRFEDIPVDWLCPVCGVGKSDFILIDSEESSNEAIINSIEYQTDDVIELKIDTKKDLSYTSGQFMNFAFSDLEGDFSRSYSIANKEGNILTFLIKLSPSGRGGQLLKSKKVGDSINYNMIAGKFTLKNTKNPKVFIATGTGLAPIYSMILNTPSEIEKKLYFGVASKKDLFYMDKFNKFDNLELKTCISRENVDGCHFGRIDLSHDEFAPNTEFYICGNPGVVSNTKNTLEKRGFKNIYSEEF